jgi:hypothetical protein
MPVTSPPDHPAESSLVVAQQSAPRPVRRKLSMALINFWLDASLLLAVGFVGWVSAVLQVVFPAPTYAAGWTLWGLTYNQWHQLQFGSLCFCALVILLHVMLHWNWVCNVIAAQVLRIKQRPDDGMQTIYGVATLIVLLGTMLAGLIAAFLMVRSP